MSFYRVLHSGPLEKGVRNLWKQYQEKPVRHIRQLWRLWKFHREFDITSPNFDDWDYSFPEGRLPDCENCLENCCNGPTNTVLLRLVDVARFVDKGWTDKFTQEKPVFSESFLQERPKLRAMVRSFHWRVFPVLKQNEAGRCILLQEDNKCSIHKDRPWVCRTFPYHLDIGNQTFSWSTRCKTFTQEKEHHPETQKMARTSFDNFYTEKIRDLVLVTIYREELVKLGLGKWLQFDEEK